MVIHGHGTLNHVYAYVYIYKYVYTKILLLSGQPLRWLSDGTYSFHPGNGRTRPIPLAYANI